MVQIVAFFVRLRETPRQKLAISQARLSYPKLLQGQTASRYDKSKQGREYIDASRRRQKVAEEKGGEG